MAVIYNVVRGDGVFFEGMTKEQIFELLAEYTGQTVQDIDQAFITKLKEVNKGNSIRLWLGTTAEYNAIQTKEDDVLYICTDDTFVQDTGIELTNLSDKIDANYRATIENLNEKEQDYQELVEQFEAISQSTLHIVDKGHYEFPLNGHSYDDAYQLPSVNVGEIGKLSFNADDATWGGLAVPSSGLYFVVASVEDFHNWDGGSDGSYIVTSNYSISFANWNKSGTFFKSVGKTRDDYYKGSGYVFYMRLL